MPAKAPKGYRQGERVAAGIAYVLRGAPIDLIADCWNVQIRRVGLSGSCHSRRPVYFKFDSSFRATVSHALEPQRDYWTLSSLWLPDKQDRSDRETIGRHCRQRPPLWNFDTVCEGDSRIFPMLVQILDFALR
jgi:hypothetical protein